MVLTFWHLQSFHKLVCDPYLVWEILQDLNIKTATISRHNFQLLEISGRINEMAMLSVSFDRGPHHVWRNFLNPIFTAWVALVAHRQYATVGNRLTIATVSQQLRIINETEGNSGNAHNSWNKRTNATNKP